MDWFLVVFVLDFVLFVVLPHLLGLSVFIHTVLLVVLIKWIPHESHWFRSLPMWESIRNDYLGMSVKGPGVDLLLKPDPKKQYIFAIHKHGVYSVSNIAYFALNKDLLHVHSVGTSILFVLPIIKELVGLAGAIPANKGDIIEVLANGKSVAMSPGGIREVPGVTEGSPIIERDGFLKIALNQNIPVVPIYAEGEEELYSCHILHTELASKFLKWFWYPIGLIFVWGHPWVPFWPKRGKITLHVGNPIACDNDLDKMKEEFYSSLGKQ